MRKLLVSTFLLSVGFTSGYVVRDYSEAKQRMTKFANVYECCAGAALAKRQYAVNSDELATVADKGPVDKMSTFDLNRLVVVWRDAGSPPHAKEQAPWVAEVEAETKAKIESLLKGSPVSVQDVDALARFFNGAPIPADPTPLTNDQRKQLTFLLERAPELNLALSAGQKNLTDVVRTHGDPNALLAADPLADVIRGPLDLVALCQVRPDIVTLHKNSTFRECVGR